MCMMKQNGETESCEVAKNLAALDGRVTKVEGRLDKMEGSLSVGFAQVNSSIQQLATDFGQRMNTLDQRIVEEKAKWGECFRNWLGWIVKLLILGCGAAMGMTAWKMIFGN